MQPFHPQRIIREKTLTIQATPRKIFPLLCPVREYDWIGSWHCNLRYSESGVAEDNCIFETDFAHNGGQETWYVSRFVKDRCIEFVRFTVGEKVVKLNVELKAGDDRTTRLSWQKVYTGLSHAGNDLIKKMAEEQFTAEAAAIETMLNHFLTTGQMWQPGSQA